MDFKNIAAHIDWPSLLGAVVTVVPYVVPSVQYLWSWVRPRQNNDQGNQNQAQQQDPAQERQGVDRIYNDNRVTNNVTFKPGDKNFESGAINNDFYLSDNGKYQPIPNSAMMAMIQTGRGKVTDGVDDSA